MVSHFPHPRFFITIFPWSNTFMFKVLRYIMVVSKTLSKWNEITVSWYGSCCFFVLILKILDASDCHCDLSEFITKNPKKNWICIYREVAFFRWTYCPFTGTPCITDCVMAELEKLGQKYRVALRYLFQVIFWFYH